MAANESLQAHNSATISYHVDYGNGQLYEYSIAQSDSTITVSPRYPNQSVEIKIGVLLPFHQTQDNWTRELTLSGFSAIRLAARAINHDGLLPGAYVTLIEQDSYPKDVQGQSAVFEDVIATMSLVQQGVVGVIGDISSSWTALSALITSTLQIPQCSYSATATSFDQTQYHHFYRTATTPELLADAALAFLNSQGWPNIGLLYSNDDYGNPLSQAALIKAKSSGVQVKEYQAFYQDSDTLEQVIRDIQSFLTQIGVRIIFVAAEGAAQHTALIMAAHMGYMDAEHVWVVLGDLENDGSNGNGLRASVDQFNGVLAKRSGQGRTINNIDALAASDVTNDSLETKLNGLTMLPLEYYAWTTPNLDPIDYQAAFAGGVFAFRRNMNLSGYPPYDQFQAAWSGLDPAMYPFAGPGKIATADAAMAYSCLMTMVRGFRKLVTSSANASSTLHQLVTHDLGDLLIPGAFNTGYEGPDGPMLFQDGGDRAVGNFRVINLQHGNPVEVGTIFAGRLNLTQNPLYFNGSTEVPTGLPEKICINPGYRTPISLLIVAFAAFGSFVAILAAASITKYRRYLVFHISSPISCAFELVAFILLYICVFFFSADRTRLHCFAIPVSFHLGYNLLLGCLSLKLYQIYQVHDNIYLKKPLLVSDRQLVRTTCSGLLVVVIILFTWFPSSTVDIASFPVTQTAYYIRCNYTGTMENLLIAMITLVAALFLFVALILAIKTWSVGTRYPKYAETKYIVLSIYNIFFSSLIGFITFRSTADYITRHYLCSAMVVWGTTIALLLLYLPKLHTIYVKLLSRKRISGRLLMNQGRWNNSNTVNNNNNNNHFTTTQQLQQIDTNPSELISINRMIASPFSAGECPSGQKQPIHLYHRLCVDGGDTEAFETKMPVQEVFRYFPHLSAWDMKHIILFPRVGYFSFVSEKSQRGRVFHYREATIQSRTAQDFVLRIHGFGNWDVLIQVAAQEDLDTWSARFNMCNYQSQHDQCTSRGRLMMPATDTITSNATATTSVSALSQSNHFITRESKMSKVSWAVDDPGSSSSAS